MSDFTFEIVAECFRDSTRVKSLLENIINSRLVRSFAGTWPVDRVTMSLGVNFIVRKLFRRRFKIFSHITHLGVAWRGKESPDRWKRDKYREKVIRSACSLPFSNFHQRDTKASKNNGDKTETNVAKFFSKFFQLQLYKRRDEAITFFTYFTIFRITIDSGHRKTLCIHENRGHREKINFEKRRGTISGRNLHGCGLLKTWHEWRKYFSFRVYTIFMRPYSTGDIYF